jgi:hypothetical protein
LETLPTCLKRDELHRQLLAQVYRMAVGTRPHSIAKSHIADPLPLVSGVPRSHPSVASWHPGCPTGWHRRPQGNRRTREPPGPHSRQSFPGRRVERGPPGRPGEARPNQPARRWRRTGRSVAREISPPREGAVARVGGSVCSEARSIAFRHRLAGIWRGFGSDLRTTLLINSSRGGEP